jgi:hypothetical protein
LRALRPSRSLVGGAGPAPDCSSAASPSARAAAPHAARAALPRTARAAPRRSARSALALALLTCALALSAPAGALADVGQTIVQKCTHGEPFGGYTAGQYREALKDMSTGAAEYTDCANLIRKAELAAAGGGTGEGGGVSHAALPLSPEERKQVQSAHRRGSAPVKVGAEAVRPGVVHANIASAVNTLPHSLFAVLALLAAATATLAAGEVRRRVRARRRG